MTGGLSQYRRKRDFAKTPEPKGARRKRSAQALRFVVQKHAARRLHYDFRLEMGGVLKSWAVPKGPSLDPGVKRLAVEVEDHPIEYGDFEGVIPEGEYGGGTVLVWDAGTWVPEASDPEADHRRGLLKFELRGKRLRGRWALVRMQRRSGGDKNWLLIKEHDAFARPGSDDEVTKDNQTSVLSGRGLEAVAQARDRVWRSNRTEQIPADAPTAARIDPSAIEGARKRPMPRALAPQLATLVDTVPPALRRVRIEEKDGIVTYLAVEDLPGLVSLVEMGVLEIHVWGSTRRDIEHADRVVLDLDPDPGLAWSRVAEGALTVRGLLAELGLQSFVKGTGGKGLRVVVPLQPRYGWDEIKAFAKEIAGEMVRREPAGYTATSAKKARHGRIFVDYLRNQRGATAVAAYSARARRNAPVAAPLTWEEVEGGIRSDAFTVATLPRRIATLKKDPWDGLARIKQSLPASLRRRLRAA